MEKPLKSQWLKEITSHPLFSIFTTFFLLCLLYLPFLLPLIFSPVFITTSLLLTTLLHFGSTKTETPQTGSEESEPIHIQPETEKPPPSYEQVKEQKDLLFSSMVEWGRRGGPLEVIYEEYEGEEEEGDSPDIPYSHMLLDATRRMEYCFGSCSTGSDADSDDSSTGDVRFRWDEEEEGMIEIALEEDNLIEIDLSACR